MQNHAAIVTVKTAPSVTAASATSGAASAAAPLLPPVDDGDAAPLPERVLLAPVPPAFATEAAEAAEPELLLAVGAAVAAAAKSCVDA